MDETTTLIDDYGPIPLTRPRSVAELGEQVRGNAVVYPLGGRTKLNLGHSPKQSGLAIDLTALNQVIDYPARDMTITVQAGIRINELQRHLAEEGQRLPLDVPSADRATLGGVLATNVSGSRRLGFGTARDYVIGIHVVNDQGEETKAGGRVVKNVAGYDFCKLHVGALGTLGIISQVTLKVRPIPETQTLLSFGCDESSLEKLLDDLHASQTRPTCLDLLNQSAASLVKRQANVDLPEHPWVILVGYEDSEAAVNWQIQQLLRELTQAGVHGVEATAGAACDPLWHALNELNVHESTSLTLQASMLASEVAAFVQRAARQPGNPLIHAHVANGIVRLHLTQENTLATVQTMLNDLAVGASQLTLPRCPSAWKETLPIWGKPRGDLALMKQVKRAIDPQRRFNPGRFLDGI